VALARTLAVDVLAELASRTR